MLNFVTTDELELTDTRISLSLAKSFVGYGEVIICVIVPVTFSGREMILLHIGRK